MELRGPAVLPAGHAGHGLEVGDVALAAIAIAAMVIPLVVLAVIGRVFYRAAKRDAEGSRPEPQGPVSGP